MNHFIAVEGVIGVGKTTLVRRLQSHFNADLLLEVFEENPFLADFYADRERYAFQTQLFFLLSRYQQQKQAIATAENNGTLISDYTFAKDELFAWLNLKDDELAMYGRVHSALAEKIRQPDLLVYLRADHETVMQRIAMRDRPYERDMDPDYIRRLAAAYEAWLSNLKDIPVLTVDVTHLDFLSRPADLEQVVARIRQALTTHTAAARSPATAEARARQMLARPGSLDRYQQFHRYLDEAKQFDTDLMLNYICLVEEVGELATEMKGMQVEQRQKTAAGMDAGQATNQVIDERRATVGSELADLLAYLLKLANYMDIDLEQVYRQKMNHNLERTWPSPGKSLPRAVEIDDNK